MDNLEHVMAQLEKSMAETKHNLAHTEALYNLLKETLSTPVAETKPITELPIEPLESPAMRAYNGLLAEVAQSEFFNADSLKMISNQPSLVQVEFRGVENPHTILLDVMEYPDGNIFYQLEKELLGTNGSTDLFKTDDDNLALKYIQKEIKRGSWQPYKTKDSYRKLLPELKQVCLAGAVDAVDMAHYSDRIDKLNQAGELTEKQLDKLNRYKEELEINWIGEE